MKPTSTLFLVIALAAGIFIQQQTLAQAPEKMSYQAVIRNSSDQLVTSQAIGMKISILQGTSPGIIVYQETYNPNPQTNANGLVSIEIGGGIPIIGTFSAIDWALGPYFLKAETDPTGSTNYTITGTSQILSVPYALYAKTAENGFSGNYNDLLNKPTIPLINDASISVSSLWSSTKTNSEIEKKANTTDVYTKTNMQTAGQALVHYNNISNKPSNIDEDKTDDVTLFGDQTIIGNKTFNGITTVATPINLMDAATKGYVDNLMSQISSLENKLISGELIVKDVDGNIYNTVRIGSTVWMAENLKTTRYQNGDIIGTTNPATLNISVLTGNYEPKYQWAYGGNEDNVATYGRLYTSWTVKDSRNVCPLGWQVPSNTDWESLRAFLGASQAGGKLKETGTTHWYAPNTGATNETGFKAIPGGFHYDTGSFEAMGYFAMFWSTTEENTLLGWIWVLSNDNTLLESHNSNNNGGMSVRCVKH
jgi:uncharacterized protein (TIGR02145 family)